jgi:hypothetical protein
MADPSEPIMPAIIAPRVGCRISDILFSIVSNPSKPKQLFSDDWLRSIS